jgi:hypothetical protein
MQAEVRVAIDAPPEVQLFEEQRASLVPLRVDELSHPSGMQAQQSFPPIERALQRAQSH